MDINPDQSFGITFGVTFRGLLLIFFPEGENVTPDSLKALCNQAFIKLVTNYRLITL